MKTEFSPYGTWQKYFAGSVEGKEVVVLEWQDSHDYDWCVALCWGAEKISQDEFPSWDYKEIAQLAVAQQKDPSEVIAEWPVIREERRREKERQAQAKKEREQEVARKIQGLLAPEEWEIVHNRLPS